MASEKIRSWRWRIKGMGLRVSAINTEDRGAIIGEEKAGEWALGRC